jgi:ATP-dependent Clp protease ATP-binding subunit ClpB
MTSNTGSHIIQDKFENLNESNRDKLIEEAKLEVFALLKKTIRPEFLNRIDETIMFTPLSKSEVNDIVKLQLNILKNMLSSKNINIEFSDTAIKWLSDKGFDPQFGARPIKRVIQRDVLNLLSKEILKGNVTADSEILATLEHDEIVFINDIV